MITASTDSSTGRALAKAWERAYGEQGHAVPNEADETVITRAKSDARAAWQRWHDSSLDEGWSKLAAPLYHALERARVEQLASTDLPGMARNLSNPKDIAPSSIFGRLYCAAREVFGGANCPTEPIICTHDGWSLRRFFSARPTPPAESALLASLRQASTLLEEPHRFAECVAPIIDALSRYQESLIDQVGVLAGASDIGFTVLDSEIEGDDKQSELSRYERTGGDQAPSDAVHAYPQYRIYSTAWDEEGPADRWLQSADIDRLRLLLLPDRQRIRQLAHRLQRRLQAARLRHWEFDQEEGRLDSRRLARLVTDRSNHQVFRNERETPVTDACVSFLVDMSGSMRGERQRLAAMTVDLAVHTLESCGIDCELLGFTTRFGAENPLEQHWRHAGALDDPGRLNALRHIVFKTANQRWQRARQGLGLMLRDDFGRENIDGESLHWAARRLFMQSSSNRILLVLSDGQPFDQSTAQANGQGFLENSLREVAGRIENSSISLIAVGTAMDVTRFYRHALRVSGPQTLAEELFVQLGDLLTARRGRGVTV